MQCRSFQEMNRMSVSASNLTEWKSSSGGEREGKCIGFFLLQGTAGNMKIKTNILIL